MRKMLSAIGAVALTMVLSSCAGLVNPRYAQRAQTPAPCDPSVSPIRYNNLIVVVNYNYGYTAKDSEGGRTWHKGDIIDRLNDLGKSDGNTFAESNGQPVNFYLSYTLNNDGQDHFSGSVHLSGWGQGNITTISLGYPYPYASSAQLTSDLTDKAYQFVHLGWHDTRPACAGK